VEINVTRKVNDLKIENSDLESNGQNKGVMNHGLWAAAVLIFALGTGLTCYTLSAERQSLPKMKAKASYLAGLRLIQGELAQGLAAVDAFAKSPDKHVAPLPELMRDTLGDLKPDEIKDVRKETVQGWVVRQKDITFSDAPLDKVMEFVRKAETQRPPWSMSKCVIRSSPRAPGVAKIELSLQAVEKTQ
jgi:hypothetical protein